MIRLNPLRACQVQVITFDCYGTLIDWESGIWTAFREAAAADGVSLDRERVIEAYHAIEPMVEEGRYRTYREVLREAARRVAAESGWSIDRDQAAFLAKSLPDWPPFPDTNAALARLAEGRRLGVLSNVDEDLLEATARHLDVHFDFWVTADRVESYKPDLAHFEAARPFVGNREGWLHVAQSLFHDVAPARCIGVPVAWINRKGERPGADAPEPDREFADLAELADWLEAG
ncbi:MAG TPA: haloacid dehalogenase type II [Gemmatimonadota bacterium]|nr:haloacid dehalogenase type II [Gemmatimonadota bacterium]